MCKVRVLVLLLVSATAVYAECEEDTTTELLTSTTTAPPENITCYRCIACEVGFAEDKAGCDYAKLREISETIYTVAGKEDGDACKTCSSVEYNCIFTLDCLSVYVRKGCTDRDGVETCYCSDDYCNGSAAARMGVRMGVPVLSVTLLVAHFFM